MKNKPQKRSRFMTRALTGTSTALAICFSYGVSYAQVVEPLEPLPSSLASSNFRLDDGTLVPAIVTESDGTRHTSLSPDLDKFLKKNPDGSLKWKEAVKLGKALFWDTQVGSDGQACASCHFHVGADNRVRNQINPGQRAVPADNSFATLNTGGGGADYTLKQGDFPFYLLNDPEDRNSGLVNPEINDVVSSQGVFNSAVTGSGPLTTNVVAINGGIEGKVRRDECDIVPSAVFHNSSYETVRNVEPRNTPTILNSSLNFDNFWDGRAKWTFNNEVIGRRVESPIYVGSTPGSSETNPVAMKDISDSDAHPGSDASQAVGPPRSDFEMSCAGRSFDQIGNKMLPLRPLALQKIDATDSVFGGMIHSSGKGLTGGGFSTYKSAIKKVFKKKYWGDTTPFADGYTQMEKNFILFFGLSVMIYESTQVTDDTPFDRWADAGHPEAGVPGFGADEIAGIKLFQGKGKCINCHATAMFTKASVLHLGSENEEEGLVERMRMNDGGIALYDNGFYNIGTTRTEWDLGRGVEEAGQELSFTSQYVQMLLGIDVADPFEVDVCSFELPWTLDDIENEFPAAFAAGNFTEIDCVDHETGVITKAYEPKIPLNQAMIDEIKAIRQAVNGAMKVPSIRMVELTGPYWHHGGVRTLAEVVQFYDRGGNYSNEERDPDITVLGLSEEEEAQIVKFMEALTDERAKQNMAPFDNPELWVPHGGSDQLGGFKRIPAVGAGGRPAAGLPPWRPFLADEGDIDGNGVVDIYDIQYILTAIYSGQLTTDILLDYRDDNGDGNIDYTDVFSVYAKCGNPGCAPL